MGKGKSKESAAQERANLLGINPIANHASGTFMSKHSIARSGSNSPLHDEGDHAHPHSFGESFRAFGRKTVQSAKDFVNHPSWKGALTNFGSSWKRATSGQDPTSKTARAIYGSDIETSKKWFNDTFGSKPKKPNNNFGG